MEKLNETYTLYSQNKIDCDYKKDELLLHHYIYDLYKPEIISVVHHITKEKKIYYIFVGPQELEIMSILKSIELKDTFTDYYKDKLKDTFGENYDTILHLNIKNTEECKYIDKYIDKEDTIEKIKKKIVLYIDNNFIINTQYLWIDYEEDNKKIYYKKYALYKNISNLQTIKANILADYISSLIDKTITCNDLGYEREIENVSFEHFMNNKKIDEYLNLKHQSLGFTNTSNGIHFMNPFYDVSVKVDKNITTENKFFLYHYGSFENNLIHLVVFNINFINIDKYWPFIKIKNNLNIENERKHMENMNIVSYYLYRNPISSLFKINNFRICQVKVHINYPTYFLKTEHKRNIINIESIFNSYYLGYNVPFMRINKGFYGSDKYKLFKKAPNKIDGKPFVSKEDLIENWCKVSPRPFKKLHLYFLISKMEKNMYSHLSLNNDGVIELNSTFGDKGNYGDIRNMIDKSSSIIKTINENIHLYSNKNDKIELPNSDVLSYSNRNTAISSIQSFLSITTKNKIELKDLKENCEHYFYDYLSIDNVQINNNLILRYKKINNYNKINNVYSYLEKKIDIYSNDLELVNQMHKDLNIKKQKCFDFLKEFKDKGLQYSNFSTKQEGYEIRIRKESIHKFKLMINGGIKHLEQFKNIIHIMKTLFTITLDNVNLNITKNHESADIDDLEQKSGDEFFSSSDDYFSGDEFSISESEGVKSSSSELFDTPPKHTLNKDSDIIDDRFILKRLTNYDPKIFEFNTLNGKTNTGYPRLCSKSDGKQPIVITQKEKDNIDSKYNGSYSKALKYGSSPENQNYYICPYIWCAKCNISLRPSDILHEDGSEKCPECGGISMEEDKKKKNRTLYIRNKGYFNSKWDSKYPSNEEWKQIYPGFLDPKYRNKDFCLPCCFKKDDLTEKKKKKLDICYHNIKSDVINEEKESKYVSQTGKIPLDAGKFGRLPEVLDIVFKTDVKKTFKDNNSGNLNINCPVFLRRGIEENQISHPEHHNSFFYSVLSIAKKNEKVSLESILDIIPKITISLFLTLNNGDLVNYFSNKESEINEKNYYIFLEWFYQFEEELKVLFLLNKTFLQQLEDYRNIVEFENNDEYTLLKLYDIYTAYIKFIDYLKSDSIKDENILLDLISRENILFKKNINIIIFEVEQDKIYPLCIKNIYLEYNNCFIIKYPIHDYYIYEPMFLVMDYSKGREINKLMRGIININNVYFNNQDYKLFPYSVISDLLLNINRNCIEIDNNEYKHFMSENNYTHSSKSYEIYELLNNITQKNYKPFYQIVNHEFKSIGFIINDIKHSDNMDKNMKNKVFIPYYPSVIIEDVPILFGVQNYVKNSYAITIETLNDINSINKHFNILAKEKIIDKEDYVIFINTETNFLIPIEKIKIQDNLPIIYKKWDYILDSNINKIKKIYDDRIMNMNKVNIEKETYKRFCYEISNILHKNKKDILFSIKKILSKPFFNIYKHNHIERILKDLIHETSLFYFGKREPSILYKKRPMNCSLNKEQYTCNKNEFCIWDDSKCKLFIPKKNLISDIDNYYKYINILSYEIVYNSIKRNEILKNNIINSLDDNNNENELIMDENNYEEKIKQLYLKNESIRYLKKYNAKDYDIDYIDKNYRNNVLPGNILNVLRDNYHYNNNDKNFRIFEIILDNKISLEDIKKNIKDYYIQKEELHLKEYIKLKDDLFINRFYIGLFCLVFNKNIILVNNHLEIAEYNLIHESDKDEYFMIYSKTKPSDDIPTKDISDFYLLYHGNDFKFKYNFFSENLKKELL